MIFDYDCEVCGRHRRVKRSPSNAPKVPRFCSQACNGASRRTAGPRSKPNHEIDCQQCGRQVAVYRSPSADPPKFCSLACLGAAQMGAQNPSFSGGRHHDASGYVKVLVAGHPHRDVRGYVSEHRLVMERHVGRLLDPAEVVHHRNRIKNDNRIENLQLLPTQSAHLKLHQEEGW